MGIIFTGSRHSIRPSLNLDFANSKALDPRITFSRTSNATYYDGYTTVKAEENLVKYSQDFDNAYWLKEAATVTANSTSAPDGTTTAELLLETTDSGTHKIYGNPPSYNSVTGNSFTVSIYCKSYVSDRYLGLVSQLGGGSRVSVRFDPSTQTLSSVLIVGSEITNVTAGYQDVGNGWYRVYLSGTFSAGNVYIAAAPSNTMTPLDQSYGFSSYSGDVTKGIYLWGAQIEQRDSLTAYTPTTNSLITKYQPALQTAGNNVARFDHNPTTGESLGLLIEENRTNLLTYSEEFDNVAWSKDASTIIPNTIIAPDGTLTADKLIATATASSNHRVTDTFSATSGAKYTISLYVKAGEYTGVTLHTFGAVSVSAGINVDLTTQNIYVRADASTNLVDYSITNVGNDWYRISYTVTATSTGTATSAITVMENHSGVSTHETSYTGDGYSGIYIWGAQVEQDTNPSSYIKTTGSQVTRSVDVATVGIDTSSDWFNLQEGTIYVNATNYDEDPGYAYGHVAALVSVGVGFSSTAYRPVLGRRKNGSYEYGMMVAGQSAYGNYGAFGLISNAQVYFPKQEIKAAFTMINRGTPALAVNGTSYLGTSEQPVPPTTDGFYLGRNYSKRSNNHFKKISYYPRALTSNELADLTEE